MHLSLATVTQSFALTLAAGQEVKLEPLASSRPLGGALWMDIRPAALLAAVVPMVRRA